MVLRQPVSVNTKYDDPINNPIYRALKYSSTSFKKIAEEFKNDRAFDISLSFKKAIGEKLYEKEKDFVKFMDSMQKPIEAFAGEIRERAEKGGFTDFENSLETLKNTIAEGIPLKIATQQDEVCFYALELKLTVNDPMYKALNCTALNFSKVAELFKSETAHNISFIFEKAVESRVYEDRDKFVKFMGENLELLRALSKELKIKASESSLNDYSLSVEELAKSIDLNDAPEIAARQQDVCSRAQNLAFSDDPINPINNPMYMALKCSVRSFKKVEEEFKNDKSLGISLLFKKAVRDKLYENENDFLDFMRKILGQINVFKEEIKTQTEEGSFKDFDGALEDLQKAIDGDTPLKVAAQQEEVCSATRGLKIYLLSDYPGYFYRALRCTAANFAKAADLFENKTAKAISEKFGIALNKKIHEDDEFRNLMEENFVLFETFAEEIKDLATKETLTKYSSSVEKLAFAIRSGEALKIATRQQKVCSAARELEIHLLP